MAASGRIYVSDVDFDSESEGSVSSAGSDFEDIIPDPESSSDECKYF